MMWHHMVTELPWKSQLASLISARPVLETLITLISADSQVIRAKQLLFKALCT